MTRHRGKLDYIQRQPQHRIFTQRIDPRDVRTFRINILKKSQQLIVVMMFKLKLLRLGQSNENQDDCQCSNDHTYSHMNDTRWFSLSPM